MTVDRVFQCNGNCSNHCRIIMQLDKSAMGDGVYCGSPISCPFTGTPPCNGKGMDQSVYKAGNKRHLVVEPADGPTSMTAKDTLRTRPRDMEIHVFQCTHCGSPCTLEECEFGKHGASPCFCPTGITIDPKEWERIL